MASATVRVRGYRELISALGKINRDVRRDVTWELQEAAKPVTASTKARLTGYQGASIGTIGPKVAASGVFVTQRARKVTGARPDFGALQMRKGFEPALEEHSDEIVHRVEKALDNLVEAFGRNP